MHDARRPLADRPMGPKGIALHGALLMVTLAVILPGTSVLGGASAQTLPAPVASVGELALERASQSLATPVGPSAAYGPCTVSSGTDVSCGTALSPHPLSGGPYAPKSWTDLSSYAGSGPSPRWLGGMTWDPVDQFVLLFGGYDTSAYSDTWSFSHDTWTALSPSASPSGRYAMGLTWDVADGYAVMFGGTMNGGQAYNDTWTFSHGQWTNVTPATPTSSNNPATRWRMAMTWDGADGYVLMFGGTNNLGTTIYSDTWSFSAGVWSKLNVTGSPVGRYRASMTYDVQDQYVVLFGGCTSSSCPDSSTWTYNNLTWTHLSPATHPASRIYFGITYSSVYEQVLLFGGDSTTAEPPAALSDTWAFTNGNWTVITSNLTHSPPAVSYLMMTFDPLDNLSIMFGGMWSNGTYSGTTWGLGPSILGQISLSSTAIDQGQSFDINATPITYANWVTYNYTQLPPGCAALNTSLLTCQPSTTGTFPISVVLNDSDGSFVTETANVTVNPVPSVASFSVSPTTVTRGSPVHFLAVGVNGTLPYTYKYLGLPPGCGSGNTPTLTCTPGGSASGPYIVEVSVTDAAGEFQNATTNLNVNPTPSFASFVARPATLDVGQTLTLYANATGGTGPFTFDYSGLPAGCASQNVSVITCAPTSSATGLHSVIVTLHDSFNWSATTYTNVTVNPDPLITGAFISPSTVDAGVAISVQVNATGGTGVLSYSFANLPSGCSLGTLATNTCTPTSPGSWNITATVTDAAAFSVSTTLALTVNPALAFVSLNATPAAVDEGQNVSFALATTGGTAPITYAWAGLPTGCVPTANSATLVCAPRQTGTLDISVTITDHFKQVTNGAVQLTVYADPSITSFTAGSGATTAGTEVDVTVSTMGGSGGFTYAYSGLPGGCSSANASTIHCTPTAVGTFNVSVTVTDSNGKSATTSTELIVNAAPSSSSVSGSLVTYAILGVVVLVVIVAAAMVMMRRQRKPPAAAPAEWSEDKDESPPT